MGIQASLLVFREVGSYGSEWEQVGDVGNTSIESDAIGIRTYLSGLRVLKSSMYSIAMSRSLV